MPASRETASQLRRAPETPSPAARLARAESAVGASMDPLSKAPWKSPNRILIEAGVPLLGTETMEQNGRTMRLDYYPTIVEGLGRLPVGLLGLGEQRVGLSNTNVPELVISTLVSGRVRGRA